MKCNTKLKKGKKCSNIAVFNGKCLVHYKISKGMNVYGKRVGWNYQGA